MGELLIWGMQSVCVCGDGHAVSASDDGGMDDDEWTAESAMVSHGHHLLCVGGMGGAT